MSNKANVQIVIELEVIIADELKTKRLYMEVWMPPEEIKSKAKFAFGQLSTGEVKVNYGPLYNVTIDKHVLECNHTVSPDNLKEMTEYYVRMGFMTEDEYWDHIKTKTGVDADEILKEHEEGKHGDES